MSNANNPVPVKPGDVLDGKYRVEKILGAGGMGVVVQARHVDLNRPIAIKFMLPEALADPEHVARFQREARAATRLQSEHTAQVTDVGRLKNGAPYMVMEFLVGKDLGQVIEESGALPVSTAVDYLLQAGEAIAEAHALGIIHRDVKPKNLFLSQRIDGRPLVKVLDFGLAKMVDNLTDRALTRTTAVMGSPQYMSPEQMRASREVDERSDIWSLGVCVYELLTGRVPFDAPTVPMLCAMVLKEPARPPHDLRPDIPLPLSAAVMRCLEKDASGRFSNMTELAAALEPFGSAAASGSATRIHHVRTTAHVTQAATASAPELPALPAEGISIPIFEGPSDTRTAASFDSRPQNAPPVRARSAVGYVRPVLGGAAFILVAVFAIFLAKTVGSKTPARTATSGAEPAPETRLVTADSSAPATASAHATSSPPPAAVPLVTLAPTLATPTSSTAANSAPVSRPGAGSRKPPPKPSTVAPPAPPPVTPPPPPPTSAPPVPRKSDPGDRP